MTPDRTDALDCLAVRNATIDELLGQSEEPVASAARLHAAGCADCRREVAGIRATIARLRRETSVTPSPGFHARVSAALDEVDAEVAEADFQEPPRGFRFRLRVLGHQLRTSRKLQLRVAAAMLPLFFGVGLLLRDVVGGDEPQVVCAPGDTTPPPPGEPRVDRTVEPRNLVEWRPKDEPAPREPVRPWPPLDELDQEALKRATDALARLNQLDAEALTRLRSNDPTPPPAPAPRKLETKEPAREVAQVEPAEPEPAAPPRRRALEWLARNQKTDGSWTPGTGEPGLETGVTALALLALHSDGHFGFEGNDPLDRAAAAAAAWLGERQRSADGRFVGGRDEASRTFCHAVACLALIERHVHGLAAGAIDPSMAMNDHDRLERALTVLELDLERMLDARTKFRCAGQVGAWAALALSTARHSGVEFHLDPASEAVVARALDPLRSDQPALMRAASRTISAMAGRNPQGADANETAWRDAIEDVLTRPDRCEPSLRFLVVSGLRPLDARQFQALLEQRLSGLQSADRGFYDSGIEWDCFGGGTVYETSLAVLALNVEARREAFSEARARVRALRSGNPPKPPKPQKPKDGEKPKGE